jgi:hypothetical protein
MPERCDEFYAERDQRTHQYVEGWRESNHVLAIVGDEATMASRAGQVLLLALLDQAVRTHRRIQIEMPHRSIPLVVPSRFAEDSLEATALKLLASIDPCGDFAIVECAPEDALTLGLGVTREGLTWYLGADGWIGELSRTPVVVAPDANWGAAVASVLGASAVFRVFAGIPVGPVRLSAWNWLDGGTAADGPTVLPDPNVGDVLCLGAGAVGASLSYWRMVLGHGGRWAFVDGDIVKVHNTNRSIGYIPADAGWPSGSPASKADLAASFVGGAASHSWYDEFAAQPEGNHAYDIVLPLANERGVRATVASLNLPLVLHATTGRNWGAYLHRHIAGIDDCVTCRLRDVPLVKFECSIAVVEAADEAPEGSADAALPFLSAAAGLMLASALARLSSAMLDDGNVNSWALDLRSSHRISTVGRRRCRDACQTVLPRVIRSGLPGGRWAALDPARQTS